MSESSSLSLLLSPYSIFYSLCNGFVHQMAPWNQSVSPSRKKKKKNLRCSDRTQGSKTWKKKKKKKFTKENNNQGRVIHDEMLLIYESKQNPK